MDVRTFALFGASALTVLSASASCETSSGSTSSSCVNGDCTVTVKGSASGDLAERGATEFEYRIRVREDQSAEVRVRQERSGERTDDASTLRPGETADLRGYTVEYVSHTEDGATFEFTLRD